MHIVKIIDPIGGIKSLRLSSQRPITQQQGSSVKSQGGGIKGIGYFKLIAKLKLVFLRWGKFEGGV